ncbi:hypothetical protein P7C70_g4565, partial [Phenoliferia sp. Uapishka_3]
VYLVREVLYDPDPYPDDTLSPIDASTAFDFSMSSTPTPASWAADPFMPSPTPTYGRNFALKCLCKKDLTDELIEIQRGEAVLHRALPEHEYIVRLYGVGLSNNVLEEAYETDDWLFLVLEYCPGQDLFFWLQADDSDSDLYNLHSRAQSPFQHHSPLPASQPITLNGAHFPTSEDEDESALSRTITNAKSYMTGRNGETDRTPPSPSLLSSTTESSLLSRKRLRLISRMFGQMCTAIQACHDVGISHRDIKPENFIVMDGREEGGKRASGTAGRVIVKITDWGLGTREAECEDFDCGSKPYMAYECRNNLNPTYDPRQADVWSLGLVLLNLLYHRNPWSDPCLSDPDFAAYVADPVGFFQDRFESIGEEVATFLSTRVFCDVLEMEGDKMRTRVTAGEFGKWASRLVMMMGEGVGRRGSVSDSTFHLISSRPPSSAGTVYNTHSNSNQHPASNSISISSTTAPSLLSQLAPVSNLSALEEMPADLREELPNVDEAEEDRLLPSAFPAFSTGPSRKSPNFSISPVRGFSPFEDDEPLPSPSFPPSSSTLLATPPSPALVLPSTSSPRLSPAPIPSPKLPSALVAEPILPATSPLRESSSEAVDSTTTIFEAPEEGTEVVEEREVSSGGGGDVKCWGEPETINPKSKRRKRGARKGRTTARLPGDTSPPTPSPLSPGSPTSLPTVDESRERKLLELAAASENLARELSKATFTRPSHSVGTQSTSALRSTTSTSSVDLSKKPSKSGSGGVFGRMRGLVMDGNQDLNALKQRAQERNASFGDRADTYSAPAKMQGVRGVSSSSGTKSYEAGTSSWGSSKSRGAEGEEPRGRSGGDVGHWSSASSRRERQQRMRVGDLSPSSTRNGTISTGSTFDSRNHTPLSSFSSVSSTDYAAIPGSGSVATVRDWRQPSPHPRPYSTSRPAKPELKDASTDTADLASPLPSPPIPITSAPVPTPTPSSLKLGRSTSTKSSRESTPSAPIPVSTPPPPPHVTPKKNKLGSLLNSISVFNRSQEKQTAAGG